MTPYTIDAVNFIRGHTKILNSEAMARALDWPLDMLARVVAKHGIQLLPVVAAATPLQPPPIRRINSPPISAARSRSPERRFPTGRVGISVLAPAEIYSAVKNTSARRSVAMTKVIEEAIMLAIESQARLGKSVPYIATGIGSRYLAPLLSPEQYEQLALALTRTRLSRSEFVRRALYASLCVAETTA